MHRELSSSEYDKVMVLGLILVLKILTLFNVYTIENLSRRSNTLTVTEVLIFKMDMTLRFTLELLDSNSLVGQFSFDCINYFGLCHHKEKALNSEATIPLDATSAGLYFAGTYRQSIGIE